MKKNLWITVFENDYTGNLNVTAAGITTFLSENDHRQLWSALKGALPPKNALSFIPPNHENATRIVKDFSWPIVRQFVADVLKVQLEQVTNLYTSTRQTLVSVTDEDGVYEYSIDHTTII